MSDDRIAFLIMVFVAVFLLATSVIVPAFGTEAKAARRLRARMKEVAQAADPTKIALMREKYLRKLSPLERWLEELPGMDKLRAIMEQAGRTTPAYRLVTTAFLTGMGAGLVTWLATRQLAFGALAAVGVFALPIVRIRWERDKRLALFEEQLPDALNSITRALRAGHPFTETLKLVGEEMVDPIAGEFRRIFSDVNYGMSFKAAFAGLLQRVPSMTLMTVVTAVLVQRETGGNLAEVLDKIAAVVRGRFRFQRRLRTLSAEGRLSAWILTLVPFVLAAVVSVTTPEYLPMLVKDPLGRVMIMVAFFNITIGIFWIRRIIRFEV